MMPEKYPTWLEAHGGKKMNRLKHKKGRPTKYRQSLRNNPYWEEVKRKVRIRDGHKCQVCGKTYNLEVHHKVYDIAGYSIVGHELEFLYCLETLCEDCHRMKHGR